MKNTCTLLFGISLLLIGQQIQAAKGYLFPAFEVNLDDQKWSFDQEAPSFLQLSGYFGSEKQQFNYEPTGLKLQLSVHLAEGPINLSDLDTITSLSFSKIYKNLYMSYNGEYGQSSYYMMFAQGYVIFIDSNKSITAAENEKAIKELIDGIAYIGSQALDRIAGYPLSKDCNEDSLKNIRKKACENRNPQVKKEKYYIDHLLTLDKKLDFSFSRWEKEMAIETNFRYTEADLALADAQIRMPNNVTWLTQLMPNHYFNMSKDSYKELRRYIHRTKPDVDYRIERISRKNIKNGAAFLISCEDTVRFLNVHLTEDDKVISYNYYIHRDLPLSYHSSDKEPFMISGKPNEKTWSIEFLTPNNDLYLLNKKNAFWEGFFMKNSFSTTSLHGFKYAFTAPIVFEEPKNIADYDLQVEFPYTERQIEADYMVMMGLADDFRGNSIPYGNIMPQVNTIKTGQKSFKAPLLKSPLIVSDYNHNKRPEFSICYVTNGSIVFIDSYEVTDHGFLKLNPLEIQSYMYQRFEIFEMCMASHTYKNNNPREINEYAPYYDHDGEDVIVVEEGYYQGYDGGDVVGVPMEDAPPYADIYNPKIYESYECSSPSYYVGGEKAMKKFLQDNIKSPEAKLTSELVVYVTCNILSNGAVQVQSAMNSNGKIDAYTVEAKRIAASMPHWTPAIQNGKPVTMKKIIPVIFEK